MPTAVDTSNFRGSIWRFSVLYRMYRYSPRASRPHSTPSPPPPVRSRTTTTTAHPDYPIFSRCVSAPIMIFSPPALSCVLLHCLLCCTVTIHPRLVAAPYNPCL
ncbi:hypothetical protein VTO73DRAFT_8182 [Trametes versicolor]